MKFQNPDIHHSKVNTHTHTHTDTHTHTQTDKPKAICPFQSWGHKKLGSAGDWGIPIFLIFAPKKRRFYRVPTICEGDSKSSRKSAAKFVIVI